MDELKLELHSPITEEEWDLITDVDLDHTPSVMFHTKHGKDVEYVKVVRVPIKGYEGSYEVDQFGRVFALDRTVRVDDNGRVYDKPIRARQLKQGIHSKGYKIVTLTKDGVSKTAFVHRLVAEAFIPNENNLPCINHKDEDKTNNFVENLEWCTVQYNSTYGKAKQKQAAKLIGRPLTEEHKRKIAEGVKRFYKSRGERKKEPLNQHISQHVGFVGHGESNANALEPATGTSCLICGEFVEGWDFPICHECRKRLKNILYTPRGQLNPEEPFRELNCTIENDGTYRGGEE